MAVCLWSREKLAQDTGIEKSPTQGFDGIVLAQDVRSQAEVGQVIAAAEEAGAHVTRRPSSTFYGGYAGAFTDPDGHAWEIAYNPGFALGEDGSLTVPEFGSD